MLENHSRISNSQINSLICNKRGFRERILSGYNIPTTTKWLLKHSDFATEDLFGTLPDSFRKLLLDPQFGPNLRMSKKSWGSGSASSSTTKQSSSGGHRGGGGGASRGKKGYNSKKPKRPASSAASKAKKPKSQHNFSSAKEEKKKP